MRRGFVLVLLTLTGGLARADDTPKPPVAPPAAQPAAPAPAAKPPEKPLSPEQAADAVLADIKATETGLAAASTKRDRWRAVRFACHGVVNIERPVLSSLAVTPGGGENGFLSTLEVFRMKIPVDLVVLSACETARGKMYKAEGVMGFTRAFMFASAPRVICSLWKVDDGATKALMVKFYELWNPKDGGPGIPTAEALRRAQEFIRSQEKWKHPYYWAAWVPWGLSS